MNSLLAFPIFSENRAVLIFLPLCLHTTFLLGNDNLYWSEYEIINYALVDIDIKVNGKSKGTLQPNTFLTLTSKDLVGNKTPFTLSLTVSPTFSVNQTVLYINNKSSSQVTTNLSNSSLLNKKTFLITEKLYGWVMRKYNRTNNCHKQSLERSNASLLTASCYRTINSININTYVMMTRLCQQSGFFLTTLQA